MRSATSLLLGIGAVSVLSAAAACSNGSAASPSDVANPPAGQAVPFVADSPSVYVAKVKNILVGMPPTDDEIARVTADPTQLKPLINEWISTDYSAQYQAKMLRFFELAFQQTQVTVTDFADQTFPRQLDVNPGTTGPLVQNLQESFARTALDMANSSAPFTNATTTTSFEMTTAVMELYAFLDAWEVDDNGAITDSFALQYPNIPITLTAAAIDPAQSVDPNSPNFMHWTDPDLSVLGSLKNLAPQCVEDPIVLKGAGKTGTGTGSILQFVLTGAIPTHTASDGVTSCGQFGGTVKGPQIQSADFSDWRSVTVRAPAAGEKTTPFYDLASLRAGSTLVLKMPRVGFFSTPAFNANWQTNTSNQMRVTVNQSLIVATGAAIDGTDPTTPPTTPGIDPAHAAPGTACFGCHQLLDPTRSILAATYSWNYHQQVDPAFSAQKGMFQFEGVIQQVNSIGDFGTQLAQHPLFASAWVNKLCYYANSQACDPNDPEFQRVVGVFQSSGYSWNALVAEILSSPLTTHAAATQTVTESGEVIAVSRRDHLCAAWNNRFGLTDVCGLNANTTTPKGDTIPAIVSGFPSDGYGRGSIAPVLPNQPTLFFRAGTENVCANIALALVDATTAPPGAKQWSSANPDAAISDFANLVMGLSPSDPRSSQAQTILKSHFTAATQSGASATDSLRSTFVAACLSPSAVTIGL